MPEVNRRSLLVARGLLVGSAACSRPLTQAAGMVEVALPIPRLLDARELGQVVNLGVQTGKTFFYPGRSSDTLGYDGGYLGPTLRVHRGDEVRVGVTNGLQVDTTVHWHGLLIPGELDGGPHEINSPGATTVRMIRKKHFQSADM